MVALLLPRGACWPSNSAASAALAAVIIVSLAKTRSAMPAPRFSKAARTLCKARRRRSVSSSLAFSFIWNFRSSAPASTARAPDDGLARAVRAGDGLVPRSRYCGRADCAPRATFLGFGSLGITRIVDSRHIRRTENCSNTSRGMHFRTCMKPQFLRKYVRLARNYIFSRSFLTISKVVAHRALLRSGDFGKFMSERLALARVMLLERQEQSRPRLASPTDACRVKEKQHRPPEHVTKHKGGRAGELNPGRRLARLG